jgi:enoyl-CoA hydratase
MVHVDVRPEATWLRMEAGKVQALDLDLVTELLQAVHAALNADAPPLVLTGTGSSFSAGVDLVRVVEGGAEYVARFLPALSRLLVDLFAYPAPVVTALNGHAVAGGALLAWCGDLRVMADGRGRIGVPELRVGVPFPAAAIEILRFATGGRGLPVLAYLGGTLAPADALAAGLVDEVVAPEALTDRAAAMSALLATVPAESFRLTKAALRRPYLDAISRADAIDDEVVVAWSTPTTFDTIRAYLERLRAKA